MRGWYALILCLGLTRTLIIEIVGGPTTTSGSTSTNGNINSSTRTHSDSPSSTRTDDNSASTRTSSPSSTATSGSSPHVGPEYDSLFAVVLGAFLGVDLIV